VQTIIKFLAKIFFLNLKIKKLKMSVSDIEKFSLQEFSQKKMPASLPFKEIGTYLIDWSLLSTFHCYPKIFQYKNTVARILWSICFLLFGAITCWLVAQCYMDYVEYEVVTQIKVITERPITFPTITICQYNPFTTVFAQDLINNYSIQAFNKSIENMSFQEVVANLISISSLTKMLAAQTEYESKKNLGQEFQINYCLFNKKRCFKNQDFKNVYLFEHGYCVQFNSLSMSSSKTVTEAGKEFGLSLVMGPFVNSNKYPTAQSKGLVVYVHKPEFDPISSEGIQVKTGEETFISLKKTLSQVQPSPYGVCNDLSDFDSDIYKFMVNSNKTYRQYDCLNLCLQQVITKICGCYYTKYPMFDQAKACLNLTQLNCTNYIETGFANGYSQRCLDKCPLECESVTYDYSVSTLDFPSREFYETSINDRTFYKILSNTFGTNVTYDLYKENFLSLNVFLSSNKYTQIIEIPKISTIDLISGIGGSIGIFLGFSIFSLIEVLELLFQVIFISVFKKRIY
jgi:hypothetical protein